LRQAARACSILPSTSSSWAKEASTSSRWS
jgi:hypothetical protein